MFGAPVQRPLQRPRRGIDRHGPGGERMLKLDPTGPIDARASVPRNWLGRRVSGTLRACHQNP
jgi:hypothetical protein